MLTRTRAPQREPSDLGPDSQPASAALEARGLSHSYGPLVVIDQLDLRVTGGEVLGIVGPSGCGKSTLLELLCGLREPDAGAIEAGGRREASARLRCCAYMPQRDLLLPWFSALDNAALAPRNRGRSRRAARDEAARLFERFGLQGFEGSRPDELSGGMRQRVAFLRTLIAGKPVLLLDEPFASLDAITRGEMQQWLAGALATDSRTVVLVTHDVEEALYLSDRVVVLSPRPGRVVVELAPPAPRSPNRAATVTAAEFGELRAAAMRALEGAPG